MTIERFDNYGDLYDWVDDVARNYSVGTTYTVTVKEPEETYSYHTVGITNMDLTVSCDAKRGRPRRFRNADLLVRVLNTLAGEEEQAFLKTLYKAE